VTLEGVSEVLRVESLVFTIGKEAGRQNLTKATSKVPLVKRGLGNVVYNTEVVNVTNLCSIIFRRSIVAEDLQTLFNSSEGLGSDDETIVDSIKEMAPLTCATSDFPVKALTIQNCIVGASFTNRPNSTPAHIAVTDRAVVLIVDVERVWLFFIEIEIAEEVSESREIDGHDGLRKLNG